jgi:hypothetical protein
VRWIALALALLLIATASGCGSGKPKAAATTASVSPAAVRVKNRLKAHGYDATIERKVRSSEPYEAHVTVPAIDFTSARAFNVDIFLFDSRSKAEAYRKRLRSRAGTFDRRNRYAVVGSALLVGSHYGQPQCKIVYGRVRCAPQPTVPLKDFNKVISVVTG